MCRRAGQSLSIKKDRNTQSLLFADLITLDQITVLEDTWSLLWCFPYCIGKVYFLFFFQLQVSVTMKGCITDRKKKLLQLWNVMIQVSTRNLLWSPCQVSGKQRLLTSWLNRDQGTCHIENLNQAPFGGSRGHPFCVGEREHVPNPPFNHIVHAENTTHFYTVGLGSDGTKRKKLRSVY